MHHESEQEPKVRVSDCQLFCDETVGTQDTDLVVILPTILARDPPHQAPAGPGLEIMAGNFRETKNQSVVRQ